MDTLQLFIRKMRRHDLPRAAIDSFAFYYRQIEAGATGFITESNIEPIDPADIPELGQLDEYAVKGDASLSRTAVIKLNGGLGTTMGLEGPKSAIRVKNALTFLDITALQIRAINRRFKLKVPLILMNSFRTAESSDAALARYPDIVTRIPVSFTQNKFPKILVHTLEPAEYPEDPSLEWNPPGHGDLYASLVNSGLLSLLTGAGYRYAFASNIDNLGATPDPKLLGFIAEKKHAFLMEVTDRTFMDRKGGHIARLRNGGLVLRESAQCPPEELERFHDTRRYRYFNTNNLWLNLPEVQRTLEKKHNQPELPIIRNIKKLNPRDLQSADVYQLESAMGSGISVFHPSAAIRVPRSRFAPVKNCGELLLLWSDYYIITDDFRLIRAPGRRSDHISISLDRAFYTRFDQLDERFSSGAPSLVECESLTVTGDVKFGAGVKVRGTARVINEKPYQTTIPDGTIVQGEMIL